MALIGERFDSALIDIENTPGWLTLISRGSRAASATRPARIVHARYNHVWEPPSYALCSAPLAHAEALHVYGQPPLRPLVLRCHPKPCLSASICHWLCARLPSSLR